MKQQSTNGAHEVKGNGFVQLAADLRECMAFQPKKWRAVLEQSANVLHQTDHAEWTPAAAAPSSATSHRGLAVNAKKAKTAGHAQALQHRPLSREEGDDDAKTNGTGTKLPRLKPYGTHATPSLAQYLNQPHLVDEILRETMDHPVDDDDIENDLAPVLSSSPVVAADDPCDNEPARTPHSLDTAAAPQPFVFPVLSTVSPRTRDGLARLPALSADEQRAIQDLERLAEESSNRQDLYVALKRFGHERITPSRYSRPRKLAAKVSMEKQAATVLAAKQRLFKSPWKKRHGVVNGQITPTGLQLQRLELVQMALEDINVLRLQLSEIAVNGKPPAVVFSLPAALPMAVRKRLQHDHDQLMELQQETTAHERAAEERVDHTLSEIKDWIPLDVLYAFGMGEFASPAQQRAAQLLFRVGQRLKINLVVQAIHQWKQVVAFEKRLQEEQASHTLQCWWRQILAVRELASRRRIRHEMEKRQRALLKMLATQENKSACKITRAMRRYVAQCQRLHRLQKEHAASRIQKFWRHQQAAWMALRHHLRQQKRIHAAIVIQRHVRGLLARRFKKLLVKIRHVELRLLKRDHERVQRQKERHRLGAVIAIQQAFRAWTQHRIASLRRRRAKFDRDKRKVVTVQAQFRGQKARQWVRKHRRQVRDAVLVIQCAWRCVLARRAMQQAKLRRQAQRTQWADEVKERRARRTSKGLLLVAVSKAPWTSLVKSKSTKSNGGPSPQEITAATRLQALWRGKKLRQRVKRDHAREREMVRRAVTRRRRLAAVCIQRHVRGIQGRSKAWHMMVQSSASKIQSAWRGFKTRRELMRMRAALLAILKLQIRWRTRRNVDFQHHRNKASRRIQAAWRRFLGKRWLHRAVRRQQFVAEEHAMGVALIKLTRKRVDDELLLQSWLHHNVHITTAAAAAVAAKGKSQGKDDRDLDIDIDADDVKSVERSLFQRDTTKTQWKRRGYDGVWQELYRDISGNSFDIDNSHFARFLKAMPRHFINQKTFPTQTVDLIFAKMKEPKSRTITFHRFNKAMAMVWLEKFGSTSSSNGATVTPATPSSEPVDGSSPAQKKKQLEQSQYLRFMHEFVLPSTLQNGKYRKLLDDATTKRLEWAVRLLRRFANRISGKEKHHKFVEVYRNHQYEQKRHKAASVLQRHFRFYKFRATLKATLAKLFTEYVDYKGHSVRFEHIESKRVISNKRPAFLRGVKCDRVVPLPFPGEEFHAFCGRHESAKDPHRKVTATLYCVDCEDAMCEICFARDHDKRVTLQVHERRVIALCSHCKVETAARECLVCGDGKVPYCDVCFLFLHAHTDTEETPRPSAQEAVTKATHPSRRLVVACVECEERVAQWKCDVCEDVYCKRCLSKLHAKGQRQSHAFHRLSYFSVLKQKAETKRHTDTKKQLEQRRRERDARRAEQERRRLVREASAVKIQAVVRSYQTRLRGKAYMKLVRQTHAAKAQRLKDERIRGSWGYKIKSVLAWEPPLKSDTKEETDLRKKRMKIIKKTLFLYRKTNANDDDDDEEEEDKRDATKNKTTKRTKKKKKKWTKKARAAVEKAATTWLFYGMHVKIVRGAEEWKNCIASVLSTQNLFHTGHVMVFVEAANRAVVVNWEDIVPHDEDAMLRAPYVAPSRVFTDKALDFRAKLSCLVDATARRVQLLYLQSIEFHDIVQFAWLVEFNKSTQKEEYWNVVLNKRTLVVPKTMVEIERMEPEERDKLDSRVALARSKLLHLLHPFQAQGKPHLAARRHAIVLLPVALKQLEGHELYKRLKTDGDAMSCARFWHETIVPDAQFGGKYADKFAAACGVAPRSSKECWRLVELLQYIDLRDSEAFKAHAKTFMRMTSESQQYIVGELAETMDNHAWKDARDVFERLIKLKEETMQLLISKAEQAAAANDQDNHNKKKTT